MRNIGIIYNNRIPEALDLSMAILHELDLPEGSWYSPAENLESLVPRAEGDRPRDHGGRRRHHPAGDTVYSPRRHTHCGYQHGPAGVHDRTDRGRGPA